MKKGCDHRGRPRPRFTVPAQAAGTIGAVLTLGRKALLSLVLTGIAANGAAGAGYPVAPDVVVFCEPTLRHALADVGALWGAQTGVKVHVFTSPTPALLAQIARHARDDVIVGEGSANAAEARDGKLIKPGSLQKIGRNQLVVAALAGRGGDNPDNTEPAADTLASLAGKVPTAIVDPWADVAGADAQAALQSLGLWNSVRAKSFGTVGTDDAVYLLTQGKARLAIVYATDVAANSALAIVEKLPPASYPPVDYWAAETAHALSPNAAKFVQFLQTSGARQQLRADGLDG